MGSHRSQQTEDEREAARTADQRRKRTQRKAVIEAKIEEKVATRTQEIFSGELHVPELKDSPETIGENTYNCQYCGAIKFKKETANLCCLNGKVVLHHFPDPPEELRKLWFNEVPEAKVFLNHTRVINNAICLSSVAVREITFRNYTPSVIFQGRVVQRMGPLQPESGIQPCFAQLYVLDSSLETTTIYANMTLPANTSQTDKATLKKLFEAVQQVMHEKNPFIMDFKQILEISEEELHGGKGVISAAARPQQGHTRVYNV